MAGAKRKSTNWDSLFKARETALKKSGGSQTLASKRLIEALVAGANGPDWRFAHAENVTSVQDFWRHPGLFVNWEDNSAWRPEVVDGFLLRGTLFGVEIQVGYLNRFLGPKTDAWLLATRKKIIAEEPKITLRPLAAKIFPMMVKAVEAGENIELLQEATLPKRLSRLLSGKVLPDSSDSD